MRVGDVTENWIGQYLEWMGTSEQPSVAEGLGWDEEVSFASEAQDGDGVSEETLLALLRAESDCVHVLRGIIDSPNPRPYTVKQACAALEHLTDDVHAMASRVLAGRLH
jgi:hypothetical protein